MTVGASGTATYPILIQPYGSGDKPVIDGEETRYYCIYSSGKSYYTIDGLELKDAVNTGTGERAAGACITFSSGSNLILQNCDINHPTSCGVHIEAGSNCIIDNNLIDTTPVTNEYEADGIFFDSGSGGHTVSHNVIYHKKNGYYVDGIQTYDEDGFVIEYNWIENVTGYASTQGSMLIQLETGPTGTGTFNVRYNVLLNQTNQMAAFVIYGTQTYNIYNNIIMNLGGGGDWGGSPGPSTALEINPSSTTSGFTLRNNILYTSNSFCFVVWDGVNAASQLNYNCWYRETGSNLMYDDSDTPSTLEWSDMRTAGYEDDGMNADPDFVDFDNQDFNLNSSSSCVDAGDDVSLTRDYTGSFVPMGTAPDIGAYERHQL